MPGRSWSSPGARYSVHRDVGDKMTFAKWLSGGKTDGVFIFFNFAIITGMAVAALVISKNIGGWVGSTSVGLAEKGVRFLGSKTRRYAGGAAAGAGIFAYRNTAGRWAGQAAEGLEKRGIGAGERRWFGLNRPFVNAVNKVAGVGGDRSYSALTGKRAKDIENTYKAAQNKSKYFNSLNEKEQKRLYETLNAQNRAELRMEDDKLEKFIGALTPDEQSKTRKEIDVVQSRDYASALKDVKEDAITKALDEGIGDIAKAIKNLSKIKEDHIGDVSPEVWANVKAADNIGEVSAPVFNKYLDKTNASDEQLEAIAKNINSLPEGKGNALKRSIAKGVKPEQITMRESLEGKGNRSPIIIPSNAGGGPRPK